MKVLIGPLFKGIITTNICLFVTCVTYSQVRVDGMYRTSEDVIARTRIGSSTGELAGPEILGQILVGLSVDSLSPVGLSGPHLVIDGQNSGWIYLRPDAPREIASATQGFYGQLAVWDSIQWGNELQNVPNSQIGHSEIRWVPGYNGLGPNPAFFWNESAIVPIIPEVNTIGSNLLGCSLFIIMHCRNRNKSKRQKAHLSLRSL